MTAEANPPARGPQAHGPAAQALATQATAAQAPAASSAAAPPEGSVAVVGGGVIGLSIAWRAARAGYPVTVFDPEPARGASWVAGGMLAPATEAWPGEDASLELGEESLRRWPGFAAELAADAFEPGLRTEGTVVAALDHADAENLQTLAAYLRSAGREAELLSGRRLRQAVPGLAPSARQGLSVPSDLAVDSRRLLDALHAAALARGVRMCAQRVTGLNSGQVHTTGETHPAGAVILAAGAHSARLHEELSTAIRPLKGEILRLRARRSSLAPPQVTVRALVESRPLYLVPRGGYELMLGATQYEAGYEEAVTAGGVAELLDGARRLLPGLGEYELVEARAGLRAASADNVPLIGRLRDGVYVASGHYRNGLLLAPITAETVLAQLAGAPLPDHAAVADPARLQTRTEEAA